MKFCELIEVRGNDFSNNIVFSDEASFEFHGNFNANRRYLNFVNFRCDVLKRSRCQLYKNIK